MQSPQKIKEYLVMFGVRTELVELLDDVGEDEERRVLVDGITASDCDSTR